MKRILSDQDLKPHDRLAWLEKLNALTTIQIPPAQLAAVEPASDLEAHILVEAASLDTAGDRGEASYKVLTRDEVFCLFRSVLPAITAKEMP